MKRDTTGKFVCNWDDETKQRVSVTLTATAWRLLDEQSQKQGISRSEVIEQIARSFDQTDQQSQQKDERAIPKVVQAEPFCTELALQNAERKVVSILESISDAFVAFDRHWHYTYVNRAASQLLRKAPEELLGKHLWNEVCPHLVEQLQHQELQRAASELIAVSWEEWEESIQRWLEVNAYPTEEGIAVYFRDITDRKRVEDERQQAVVVLRESEEKLRLFIQQAPVSVAMLDKNMHYVTASQRWIDSYKLVSIEAVIGRSHYDVFPNLPDTWKQLHQRCLASATEQRDEGIFQLPDGSEQYLRWEVQPWYVSSGIIGGIVIFSEDITERKQAEQALCESEQRYRTIVHTANEGIWLIDSQAQTLYSNDRMAEMLGYTAAEMLERTVLDCCFAEDIASGQERIGSNLRGSKEQFDFRFRCKDGSERLVLACTSPMFDGQGKIVGALGMFTDVTARRQVEAALRSSAGRLSVALTAARLGDWSWEAATDVVTFSERAAEIFGIPPGTHMTWTQMQTILHETDRKRTRLQVEQAIADHSDYDVEYRVIHPEGTERWVAAKGRAQYNPFGQVLGMLGVVQDITDRKQAEQEREQLLTRERMAREEAETTKEQIFGILGSITDGFLAFDRQWRFTYLNQEGSRTLGRSPEELLGKHVWAEFPELADTEFGQLYQRAVAEGVPLELEGYYAPFDSWFSVRAYPSSVGLSLYFRNINDRKRAEAKIALLNRDLQNRVNELQTLFEVIPIGILITDDPTFKQIRSNPAFAQILGIAADNASWTPPQGTPLPSYKIFSHGKELTPEETPLRRAAIEGLEIKGTEVDILRGDGALFNLYGYTSPLFDEQGCVRGAVGAFLDITDRKQSEAEREHLLEREQTARKQAEAANRIKDEFLAVLSHELRTPLNPILGWTRLLRAGKLNAQKTAMALETIERNAKLQTQLIEDLLDVSRILRGKLSLNMAPVDLPLIIEAAIETVRLAAEAKAICIHMVLNPIAEQVLGDSARLQQVVWNLLSNAVKFTPEGGQIDICLERVDREDRRISSASYSYAQIQVSDTGKGISPDFLPYVFDYFRQADATTTRQFGGLGLGLAIVRQLVELHGGTVQATSPGEDQGTTFTVKLPLLKGYRERSSHEPDSLYPSAPLLQPLQGVRVLVVDDEADARSLTTFILEEAGAIPTVAVSASEALFLFPQLNPDVIISDIGMAGMDGYMLIQQIRMLPPEQGGQVPAVALTAYAGETDQQQAITIGFQYHLTKPVKPNELIEVILSLIDRSEKT